jgi:4-amino-4-deoxy-L-arabinose transferase-like glycosyltransferase
MNSMSREAQNPSVLSVQSAIKNEPLFLSRRSAWCLVGVIVVLFCIRNLPWHLDNFDQAKQAYVSFEMVGQNHWWFQHTPMQNIATKPPLAGWISASIYCATRCWDFAWRMPSLFSALVILFVLIRGTYAVPMMSQSLPNADFIRLDEPRPRLGGVVAAAAFSLNFFAPRLATLVRTDMLLTLFIFFIGWMIFEKVRIGATWSLREKWMVFLLVLGSMLTKGPIAYAFLLPGLVAFAILCRRKNLPNHAWSGWWNWVAPLLIFFTWAGIGIWQSREFYDQVVLKEFLGRFTTGEHAVHKNQPVYFYVTHLLVKFSPWSLLLIAMLFVKNLRVAIASKPHLLWLACWSLGGLIFMSLVPSKRPDRIFPVILPLSLLVACLFEEMRDGQLFYRPARRVAWITICVALTITTGSSIFYVIRGYKTNQDALVEFGKKVRATTTAHGWRFGAISGKDEGMLLYLRLPQFTKIPDAVAAWKRGALQALVLPETDWKMRGETFQPSRFFFSSKSASEKNSRYIFIVRGDAMD